MSLAHLGLLRRRTSLDRTSIRPNPHIPQVTTDELLALNPPGPPVGPWGSVMPPPPRPGGSGWLVPAAGGPDRAPPGACSSPPTRPGLAGRPAWRTRAPRISRGWLILRLPTRTQAQSPGAPARVHSTPLAGDRPEAKARRPPGRTPHGGRSRYGACEHRGSGRSGRWMPDLVGSGVPIDTYRSALPARPAGPFTDLGEVRQLSAPRMAPWRQRSRTSNRRPGAPHGK